MTNPVFNRMMMNRTTELVGEPMTINGTINKTLLSLLIMVVSGSIVWDFAFKGYIDKAIVLGVIGMFGSLILSLFIVFIRKAFRIAVPIYAALEGLCLGGVSAYIESTCPGIAIQAILATFATLFFMLFLYRTGLIKCSEKFRAVLFISTCSVFGIYLVNFIGSFFGLHIPQINTTSNIGIGFSLFVVAIASLNLIIDFDFIERGAEGLLSKEYEWYGAFGLMVTLVWLYLEILKLLGKLRNR